jgi:hypothetical protein
VYCRSAESAGIHIYSDTSQVDCRSSDLSSEWRRDLGKYAAVLIFGQSLHLNGRALFSGLCCVLLLLYEAPRHVQLVQGLLEMESESCDGLN